MGQKNRPFVPKYLKLMDYNYKEIEQKWQQYWRDNHTYKCDIDKGRPKFYVLDMFPYPSGAGSAGLHRQ